MEVEMGLEPIYIDLQSKTLPIMLFNHQTACIYEDLKHLGIKTSTNCTTYAFVEPTVEEI
jgi:hypothetical protein